MWPKLNLLALLQSPLWGLPCVCFWAFLLPLFSVWSSLTRVNPSNVTDVSVISMFSHVSVNTRLLHCRYSLWCWISAVYFTNITQKCCLWMRFCCVAWVWHKDEMIKSCLSSGSGLIFKPGRNSKCNGWIFMEVLTAGIHFMQIVEACSVLSAFSLVITVFQIISPCVHR